MTEPESVAEVEVCSSFVEREQCLTVKREPMGACASKGSSSTTKWPPWLRRDARLWLAVTIALASAIELLLSQWIGHPNGMFDFHMYLNAAWAAREGGSIYPNPGVGAGVHGTHPASNYYIYPVPFVLLFLPLTFVPTGIAELCARMAEIALLTLTAWALIHTLTPRKQEVEHTALAAVVIFHLPIIARVDSLGQADAGVLALAALSFLFASRATARGEWYAGLALGAAALIKPYIGLLVLFYLWKHLWRAAAGTLITVGVGVGFGILALGLPDTLHWLQSASSAMLPPHVTGNFTVSLYSLAVRSALVFQPALFAAELPLLRAAAGGLVGLGLLLGAHFIRPGRASIASAGDEHALSYGWECALAVTLLLLTFPTIEDLHTSLVAVPVVLLGLLAVRSASAWLQQYPKRARGFWCGLAFLALYLSITSAALAAAWQVSPILLPIWRLLNGTHEAVAWLALPVALALLARISSGIRRGKSPQGWGLVLLLWSLAAVLNLKISPIEYREQGGPWGPHVGAAAAGLHPLAGLVPLGIIATLSIALIAAARLNLVP